MTGLKQYVSTEFGGLEIVIDDSTGEVYASQRAIARLIDKEPIYVRNYAEQAFKGGKEYTILNAQILTAGGLQGGKLYDESFILDIIAEYNLSLFKQFAKSGLRLFFHKLAGFQASED